MRFLPGNYLGTELRFRFLCRVMEKWNHFQKGIVFLIQTKPESGFMTKERRGSSNKEDPRSYRLKRALHDTGSL